MGEYVDLTQLTELVLNESKENRQEFTKELQTRYRDAFVALRNQLQAQYTNAVHRNQSLKTIEEREAYGRQVVKDILKSYPSTRGAAYILPKENIEDFIRAKRKKQTQKQALSKAREFLYSVGENEKVYKECALRMMALTYALRRDLNNNKEEHFALIYSGDSQVAKYFDIPVTQLLMTENIADFITLQNLSAAQKWSGGVDQGLRFKHSILQRLKDLNYESKDFENFNFMEQHYNKAKYRLRNFKTQQDALNFKQMLINEFGDINDLDIYRTDSKKGYWVISHQVGDQLGFADQGIFGNYINDPKATTKNDTEKWYKRPDSSSDLGEFSVKSFLGSDPSLVSLNSLYQSSAAIIKILDDSILNINSSSLDTANKLRKEIFDLDVVANKDVEKVVNIIKPP